MVFGKKKEEVTESDAVESLKKEKEELEKKLNALKDSKVVEVNEEPSWTLQDIPVETKPMIVNSENPEEPKVYTLEAAIVELLNRVKKIEKAVV